MHYQDEEVYVSVSSRSQCISLVSPTEFLHELPLLLRLGLVAQEKDCCATVSPTHAFTLHCVLPRILSPTELLSADIVTGVCIYRNSLMYDQKGHHDHRTVNANGKSR